jgi:hypothetical protein
MPVGLHVSGRAARVILALLAVVGVGAVALLSVPATQATNVPVASPWRVTGQLAVAAVPVKRCPTSLGAPNPRTITLPATQLVQVIRGTASTLAAFTDGAGTLDVVAPTTWQCTALDAVDGSSSLIVYPPGAPKPEWGRVASVRRGIVASQTGACVGCSLQIACRLFPGARHAYVRVYGVACRSADGRDEVRTRVTPSRVLFMDPPGVRGAGRPSGGGYAALGTMLWHLPGTTSLTAWQETCTLPDELHDVCVISVRAFLARHPH